MRIAFIYTVFIFCITACNTTKNTSQTTSHVTPEIWPRIQSSVPQEAETEAFIANVLANMSLEEKVGQIIQAEINYVTPEDVKKYHLGSVLSGGGSFPNNKKTASAEEWLALADAFYLASTDASDGFQAIPILWGADAVHGHNNTYGSVIFPHNIGLGATRNKDLMREIAQVTAIEVSATGIDWTFAPAVAVPRDDRWGRTYEGFAETPTIVSQFAGPIVEGLQGRYGQSSFMDEQHIVASAKVFLGDGGTYLGKDQGNNLASEHELRDLHSIGFQKAIAAGVQTIMAGFNSWQGVKLHGHKGLLTDVLKTQMGFDGFVVSDWNAHAQIPGCKLDSCAHAITAGIDMLMVPEDWKAFITNTIEQVNKGEISMQRLDDAVTRILRVKARYGIFTKPKPSSRLVAKQDKVLGKQEHRATARAAVRQSLVLLKNNSQILPLMPNQKVLLLGDGADNISKQCGGWTLSWQGSGNANTDFPNGDSVYTALAEQIQKAGGQLELMQGEQLQYQQKPDVAILVFGEDPYAEFHGDRNTLVFQEEKNTNLQLLQALQQENIPVVSIFISGRPMWVNPYLNLSQAFVAAWLPGSEAGGIADVLLRDSEGKIQYDFKGKLSFSWPRYGNQTPLNIGDRHYQPLFAYGYGLSYKDTTHLKQLDETIDAQSQKLSQSLIVFNEGQSYLPWTMYVQAPEKEAREVIGYLSQSENKEVSVRLADKQRQGDSFRIEWTQKASAYFEAYEAQNLKSKSLVVHLQARIDALPTGKISLSIHCGDNCSATFDLGAKLDTWPPGEWKELSIPLSCFNQQNFQLSTVNQLKFDSDAEMKLSLHQLSIEKTNRTVDCPI